jgi:type IV pilus assembly protein PilA
MKKMMQKGFTLIELMIVVAIIAILAAIAIPAYQDYLIRSQVSEGASLASGAKTAVSEYYSNYGDVPADNEAAGLAEPEEITGNYVSSVTVGTDGEIEVAFEGEKAHTNIQESVLAFMPTFPDDSTGSTTWACNPGGSSTDVNPKYLPAICRDN